MSYFKLTNETETHFDLSYKDGINVDELKFNKDGECTAGGIYFGDETILIIHNYLYKNFRYIREVEIPVGEKQYIKEIRFNKWKSHSLFLHERHDLSMLETWKWMENKGILIHNEQTFIFCINHAYIDVLKYLKINLSEYSAIRLIKYIISLELLEENSKKEIIDFINSKIT